MTIETRAQRMKAWVSIVPLWIRIAMLVIATGVACYWSFEDRGVYAPVARALKDNRLGFFASWIVAVLPCLVIIHVAAALLHRRAKQRAIPKAIARERR